MGHSQSKLKQEHWSKQYNGIPKAAFGHPQAVYHRAFYVLRLSVQIRGRENVIKTEIRTDGPEPELYINGADICVPLSDIAKCMSAYLNSNGVSLNACHYDNNCPSFVLGFSPQFKEREIVSLLEHLCNVNDQAVKDALREFRLIKRKLILCSIQVQLSAFLCLPSGSGSAITQIDCARSQCHYKVYEKSGTAFNSSKISRKSYRL